MSVEQTVSNLGETQTSSTRLREAAGVVLGLDGVGEVAAFVGSLAQRDFGMAAAYGSFAAASLIEANRCLSNTEAKAPIANQV